LLTSPAWMPISEREVHLQINLPRQGISLVRLSW
jgi:hypothetical protein